MDGVRLLSGGAGMTEPNIICVRCGYFKMAHWLVNYADGPAIGISVLICPTATFGVADDALETMKSEGHP